MRCSVAIRCSLWRCARPSSGRSGEGSASTLANARGRRAKRDTPPCRREARATRFQAPFGKRSWLISTLSRRRFPGPTGRGQFDERGCRGVLTTVAACTGAGAFIDFYIGKDGQKRVKDWLETWWIRLSYIPVRAVGREEALNALRVIDYLFGPKLFSWKRLRSASIFKLISLCISFAIRANRDGQGLAASEGGFLGEGVSHLASYLGAKKIANQSTRLTRLWISVARWLTNRRQGRFRTLLIQTQPVGHFKALYSATHSTIKRNI